MLRSQLGAGLHLRNPQNDETEVIPSVGHSRSERRTAVPPGRREGHDTSRSHVAVPDEADTVVLPTVADEMAGENQSWVSNSKSMGKTTSAVAIAGLFSKLTGFARTLIIVWVLGFSVTADAYNVANSMPNQVYELLVGGVLTSVMVPLLVRAHKDEYDGGEVYTQRLVTMTTVALLVITIVAILSAPLLTDLLVDNSSGKANPTLAMAFAYLLLPQILFYGLSALFGAILNARNIFGPPAWAPVLNNVILISTFALYLLPGMLTLNPVSIKPDQVLILGVGSTLGVVSQAAVMIPSLLRCGFRFRWRWGWDPRFAEFGGLALWTVGYALLAQVGVFAVTNVTTSHGGLTIYNNVWLLVQLPYGVIGFALITAILPRMSRAAANDNTEWVKKDLSLATRLSVAVMLPMSVLMSILGPSLSVALFTIGKGSRDTSTLGIALASAAFGVLPYAITLIQLRVFYALKDARTPTIIMLIMVGVKVMLTYAAPALLSDGHVVYGVTFANSASFVVGWIVGEIWLRKRLGAVNPGLSATFGKTIVASLATAVTALSIQWAVPADLAGSWLALVIGSLVGLVVAFAVLTLLKSTEMRPLTQRLRTLSKRNIA